MKIFELNVRVTKIMKMLEFKTRIMKINKLLQLHANYIKIKKNKNKKTDKHEHHEILKIPLYNHENQ